MSPIFCGRGGGDHQGHGLKSHAVATPLQFGQIAAINIDHSKQKASGYTTSFLVLNYHKYPDSSAYAIYIITTHVHQHVKL